jgi:hypothetical protein
LNRRPQAAIIWLQQDIRSVFSSRFNFNFESVREKVHQRAPMNFGLVKQLGGRIVEGQIFQSRERRYEISRAGFSQDKILGNYVS